MSHYESGDYMARIVRQGYSAKGEEAKPFFFIEIEPIEALGANNLPETIYRRSIDWFFTEAAAPYSIEKLRALGWTGSTLAELEPGNPNHHSFVGQEIKVYNKSEGQYDRFEMAREGGGSASGGGPQEVAGIASKLDKLFGKSLLATAQKTAPKKAAPKKQEPVAANTDNEEIPF